MSAATPITLTATFLDADGQPASGHVTFRLSAPLQDTAGNVIVAPTTVRADLDADGHMEVALFATADEATIPQGLTYRVTEQIAGASIRRYDIVVAAEPATVDLADLAPVVDSAVAYGGPAGPQGEQGPQGEIGPVGPQGPQGVPGEQGPQGVQGATGEQGAQGPQGVQGPAGSDANVGAHEAASDPHSQYLTEGRGDARYDLAGAAATAQSAAQGYADTAVAAIVGTAPETLDTLNELASALGNDPNFATTVSNAIGAKAGKAEPNTFTAPQTVHPAAGTDVPLTVRGGTGQTANLIEVRDSGATNRLTISNAGYATLAGNLQSNNGVRIGSGVSYTTGQRWLAVENAAAAPTSVSNGAIVFAEGGTLKLRTATGVVDLGSAVEITDPRLTDARTPTAHKTSHAAGGADAVAPADIGAVAVTSGMVVVSHGSTAGTARPAGAAVVYWIGSATPANAQNQDLWYDTTGDV
jgi:hypothetical protein